MVEPASALREVRERIASAAKIARREPASIELVAVSKTPPASQIVPLIEAGQHVFGENRVQEAQEKWPALLEQHEGLSLHLVGQLQSNKAEDAARLFDCIHSLDRPSLVSALAKAFDKVGRQVPCFVQVDIGDEPQKGGVAIADLGDLLALAANENLRISGLMAIPPVAAEPAPYFALLARLAQRHGLPQLSMGMSSDYDVAARLGATCVRVGRALFGSR